MRMNVGCAISVLVFAVSCTTPDPFARTEIGKKRIDLHQNRNFEDAAQYPEKDTSFDDALGNAAFEMTRGMAADRAIQTFEADGASCSGSTCVWKYTVREALFPCGVPPLSLVSMCVRQPGPRRTFEERYEVTLLGPRIQSRGDISNRTFFRTVEGIE